MLSVGMKRIYEDFMLFALMIRELPDRHFLYKSQAQIREEKRRLIQEVERDTAFKLLSKFEADLKEDLEVSVYTKNTVNPLGAILRSLYNIQASRVKARHRRISKPAIIKQIDVEVILIGFRDHFLASNPILASRCSILKGYFSVFRNWYAHGRHRSILPATPQPAQLLSFFDALS